ncbi:MAG: UDP-N-acetylmuramoyl-L-alanyl-D-glutamate--2,6-diaminopimelate ligase [Planctomycetes bacterium]|nr:UDP-N-acetylmuramoyl-L-alanyl-D-glutamate--2,6-diaminopimelate ligase [Planctomycetota bacterium]
MQMQCDSRLIDAGDSFVAVCDNKTMRRQHIVDAQSRGAQRIIAEDADADVRCGHARYYLARLAARASGVDCSSLPIICVTGTDGKSTTAHCVQHCLGTGAARIGTLGMDNGQGTTVASLTTPAAHDIHTFIQTLPEDCPGLAMEVSSHGSDQQRIAGLKPQVVVWTGISRDHLDYHKDFSHYLHAKLELIRSLSAGALCVINADDEFAHVVEYTARCVGVQCVSIGCVQGDIRLFQEGAQQWRVFSPYADMPLELPLMGKHNAWNALAAAVAVGALGIPLSTALLRLADVPLMPGRMELCSESPRCYVDYAHTAHALQTVLDACREACPKNKIHLIFGCGGDRDHGKRAAMGTVATSADFIYVTNDNPRSEDPQKIAQAICGTHACATSVDEFSAEKKFLIELDRAAAIESAITHAGPDDIVLIAGKGHECEQVIGDQHIQWHDAQFVRQLTDGDTCS